MKNKIERNKKVNQDQKKYLMERIEEIKGLKITAIKLKTPEVDVRKYLSQLRFKTVIFSHNKITSELMKNLIRDKRIPNESRYSPYWNIREVEMFKNYKEVKNKFQDAEEKRNKIIEQKKAVIENYTRELKDQIMLGNSEEALKQLKQFENMNF